MSRAVEQHTNNSSIKLIAFAFVVIVIAAVAWFVYRLTERTINAIDREFGDGFWLLLAVILALLAVFTLASGAVALARRWHGHVYARDGLFPVIQTRQGHVNLNETGAQTLAALGGAAGRVSAPTAARVIDQHYRGNERIAPPTAPVVIDQPPRTLTARDIVSVDPKTDPHWLIVGTTGSGKTVASFSVLREMANRARCQFVICEPGGVNWNDQAVATDTAGIVDVIANVHEEMVRRQEMLRQHDVDHITDLPDPPPYLVLVAEETESVLDDLQLIDRQKRVQTIINLRTIARQGRKPGVCLVAISQSGTGDVFDSHVRKNLSNVLLFRSEHTVSQMWRLAGVKLSELPQGAAYSIRHAGTVQFPFATRPQLLQLSNQDNRNQAYNWPAAETVVPVAQSELPVVPRLERGREPDAQLAATMRGWYETGTTKTDVCFRVWGYKDGVVWPILQAVLEGKL